MISSRGRRPCGVLHRSAVPHDQTGPWCFSILPQIELSNAYESDAYIDELGIFRCPSRDRGGAALPASFDRYGDYQSGGHAMAKTDYVANGRLILNRPDAQTYRDIWDGTSHTILLGEKAFDPVVHVPTTWYWDEPIYIGGSAGTHRIAHRSRCCWDRFSRQLGIGPWRACPLCVCRRARRYTLHVD